jgi:hypothetical protein
MCELPAGTGAAEARPSDASHRPGAHVRERDILLATKLRVPRSRPDVLVRPRLLDRVEEAAARELLLVSAPAGFGKSTLLAEWARATNRPVGWVSLDSDDNDQVRLWRYLLAAVEQVHPGLQERVLPRPAARAPAVTIIMINAARPPRRGDAARSTGEGTPRLRRHRTAMAADSQRHATGGWVRICASASV